MQEDRIGPGGSFCPKRRNFSQRRNGGIDCKIDIKERRNRAATRAVGIWFGTEPSHPQGRNFEKKCNCKESGEVGLDERLLVRSSAVAVVSPGSGKHRKSKQISSY